MKAVETSKRRPHRFFYEKNGVQKLFQEAGCIFNGHDANHSGYDGKHNKNIGNIIDNDSHYQYNYH